MFQTKYGMFDGDSWEALCQQCFKAKYGHEGYQEMVASPGDYGIEGYTKDTGIAFQCYCPDGQYTQQELYEKIRDKITTDLNKLKEYKAPLADRLGGTKIRKWYFVTPVVNRNDLLRHAATKSEEVADWGLPFIDSSFSVEIRDADFYATEIHHLQKLKGTKLLVGEYEPLQEFVWDGAGSVYFENVRRKNKARFTGGVSDNIERLNSSTIRRLATGDALLRSIAADYADQYFLIVRVISQYEDEVEEKSVTWAKSANELIDEVKVELRDRLLAEGVSLSGPDVNEIVNHVIARWLALCPLDVG